MGIKIPLGIENFAEMRENGYYYIDKTAFIKELLGQQFKANLVTRPRRFGKSLTIGMLEDFFDIRRDSRAHFEGLEISKEDALCKEWMNRWPVLSLSFKSVEGLNFKDAYGMLEALVADLCKKYEFLEESTKVNAADRELFQKLEYQKAGSANIKNSLLLFTRMMTAYYGKPTILLIDEYDVPLAKASEHGYYVEMLDVIRAVLGGALKTNDYLKFGVVTGCLRISKESIFTGMNNFVTDSITGDRFNEYLGFTSDEVRQLLENADLSDHMDEVREWYDGYRFGNVEVYCPWAVLNHVNALQLNPSAKPKKYWGFTGHNGIIYQYMDRSLRNVKTNLNKLMDGGVIVTQMEENLTYDYLKSSAKNFWSLLYLSGYLTNADPADADETIPDGTAALRIPNKEVREIFQENILEWFDGYVGKIDRTEICRAIWDGNLNEAERLLSALLLKTVSYYDHRESFFHAFLAGLFAGGEYDVETNNEYGTGRPDVVVRDDDRQRALVIEVKYAKTESEVPGRFREAQKQFAEKRYLEGIPDDYTVKTGYCAVFCAKKCFLEKVPAEK